MSSPASSPCVAALACPAHGFAGPSTSLGSRGTFRRQGQSATLFSFRVASSARCYPCTLSWKVRHETTHVIGKRENPWCLPDLFSTTSCRDLGLRWACAGFALGKAFLLLPMPLPPSVLVLVVAAQDRSIGTPGPMHCAMIDAKRVAQPLIGSGNWLQVMP